MVEGDFQGSWFAYVQRCERTSVPRCYMRYMDACVGSVAAIMPITARAVREDPSCATWAGACLTSRLQRCSHALSLRLHSRPTAVTSWLLPRKDSKKVARLISAVSARCVACWEGYSVSTTCMPRDPNTVMDRSISPKPWPITMLHALASRTARFMRIACSTARCRAAADPLLRSTASLPSKLRPVRHHCPRAAGRTTRPSMMPRRATTRCLRRAP